MSIDLSHNNVQSPLVACITYIDPWQIQGTQPEPVYADIGPSSLSTKVPIIFALDDGRVEYAQINHGLLKKKDEHSESVLVMNMQPPRQGIFCNVIIPVCIGVYESIIRAGDTQSVDLDMLLIQLRPTVSSRWYQFGEAAGIGKDVLDSYAKSCPPGDCIVEMLDYWVRNSDAGKPTWKDVARVLREIGLEQLADDIESVYSTGTFMIQKFVLYTCDST